MQDKSSNARAPCSFARLVPFACQQMTATDLVMQQMLQRSNLDKYGANVKHWKRDFRQQQTLRSAATKAARQ